MLLRTVGWLVALAPYVGRGIYGGKGRVGFGTMATTVTVAAFRESNEMLDGRLAGWVRSSFQ